MGFNPDGGTLPAVAAEFNCLLQHLHAWNAEEPLASKSTLGKRPNVSGRFRTCQNVSEPSVAIANGAEKHPLKVSAGGPLSSALRFVGHPERDVRQATPAVPSIDRRGAAQRNERVMASASTHGLRVRRRHGHRARTVTSAAPVRTRRTARSSALRTSARSRSLRRRP